LQSSLRSNLLEGVQFLWLNPADFNHMMRVIGLISGTSVDGIDAALINILGTTIDLRVELLAGATYPYPAPLRQQILAVAGGAALSLADLASLDDAIADQFAQAAIAIQAGQPAADLIGSHGQTVYHRPTERRAERGKARDKASSSSSFQLPLALGYSLQLGRGEAIAQITGITTISNFRAADIALGGEGAPLVSSVDACLLRHPVHARCVQNIGGIGNVTYLPALKQPASKIWGWDTGPGNSLLDLAVQSLSDGRQTYDQNGDWAASGNPCEVLVEQWLQQAYFHQAPPKSTGRELFGQAYFQQCYQDAAAHELSSADLLATLTELTAASIAHSYHSFLPQMPDQVLLCGGGSRNLYLKQRLQARLSPAAVLTTDQVGLSADFKEAIAFAVLGYWQSQGIPGNLPEVTGAQKAVVLGEIHRMI
jgi:anhydro-N-acetylmuramic acid kinase